MADNAKTVVDTTEDEALQTQQPDTNEGQEQAKQKEQPEGEAKYTAADIEKMIKKRFERWQAQKEKELDEAKKLAEMNAAEKVEYERDQLRQRVAELEQKDIMGRMYAETRRELSAEGINAPDELIATIVSDDAEKTKDATKAFIELFNNAVAEAVTQKLSGATHKAGQPIKSLTKADILAITDRKERQKKINENLDLFQ